MNKAYRLSKAIDLVGEDFIDEVLGYTHDAKSMAFCIKLCAGFVAALAVFLIVITRAPISKPIVVYAYGTDQKIESAETVMLSVSIGNDGSMQGMPLQFYVIGDGIQKIDFSCKNQWLTGTDWTEKRESHGLCKSFTMEYGEDTEDYYYIVIEWVPNKLIRKLTDHADIGIENLTEEERKDIIIMDVWLLNGVKKTMAINIVLKEDGHFASSVSDYEISEEGVSAILHDDSLQEESTTTMEACTEMTVSDTESMEADPNNSNDGVMQNNKNLSEEEMDRVMAAIDNYYKKTSHKVDGYALLDHYAPIARNYDGYEDDEVIYFEVTERGCEIKRYIVVGSKDNWKKCVILNEGY